MHLLQIRVSGLAEAMGREIIRTRGAKSAPALQHESEKLISKLKAKANEMVKAGHMSEETIRLYQWWALSILDDVMKGTTDTDNEASKIHSTSRLWN